MGRHANKKNKNCQALLGKKNQLGSVQSPETAELSYPAAPGPAGTPPPMPCAMLLIPSTPKLPFVLANAPWQYPDELIGKLPPYWLVPAAPAMLNSIAAVSTEIPIAVALFIQITLVLMPPRRKTPKSHTKSFPEFIRVPHLRNCGKEKKWKTPSGVFTRKDYRITSLPARTGPV